MRITDGGFVSEVPEPVTLSLLGAGLLGLGAIRRRRD
ncbi:MAG TPA: PEP-CTERM sorting domain-containing protein [Alphaproteobacteria bacterium]|nr:PEP-CTERM sorting domain-containing protein [Alphaproteobacteria bacterium]